MTYDELLHSLRRWWCHYYKRPYKDPLLDEYTFEELAFEYFDITEAKRDKDEPKAPKEIPQDEWDWAAEEEAREAAELAALAEKEDKASAPVDDNITEEGVGLTDDAWAAKYDPDVKAKLNPSADESDEGGDISASFGE